MPPSYVKPYVKRGKTDGETGPWPQMRPRKPVERCRGDLRSGHAADDALRAGEAGGAPGRVAGPQDAFARSLGRIAFAGSPSSASAPSW